MRSEEETEKKVELLASVATALARYDFPVPGGPNNRMPLHGVRLPEIRRHVGHERELSNRGNDKILFDSLEEHLK